MLQTALLLESFLSLIQTAHWANSLHAPLQLRSKGPLSHQVLPDWSPSCPSYQGRLGKGRGQPSRPC